MVSVVDSGAKSWVALVVLVVAGGAESDAEELPGEPRIELRRVCLMLVVTPLAASIPSRSASGIESNDAVSAPRPTSAVAARIPA